MSEVKRYHLWASLECQHFSKAEAVLKFSAEEDGMWVQWQDYASLKEEVDRLNREASDVERFNNSQCEPNTRGYYLKLLNQAYDQGNEHYRLFVVERSKAGMAEDEIKRLKAEVERLAVAADWKTPARKIQALEAEVERLRKAIQKFQAVAPNASNPCGCGFWTCETKDLLELNDALEGKQS